MVTVVNGYVCFTSCDAAAAKQGKNPAAPPGSLPGSSHDKASRLDGPATVLDGALKRPADAQGLAGGSDQAIAASPRQRLDLLI